MRRTVIRLAALLLVTATPALAQRAEHAVGGGAYFQGYAFGAGLPITAANLFIVPAGYQLPLGERVSLDLYSAYARGSVERDNVVYTLNGVVDTRLRASWAATPWAAFTVGVNLPTGDATHDANEAIVAGALATNLLGFREASWGTGLGVTTGVATAYRLGAWGVGIGGSYTLASGFEPQEGNALEYVPGDETLVRVGLDRNLTRSSKLTLGATYQSYSTDELNGRNLYQSGDRWRGDATYSFRAGRSSTWTLYLSDVWREHGDHFIPILTADGELVRDSVAHTGAQNLLIAGVSGAVSVRPGLTLLPTVDARLQSGDDVGASGWLVGGGLSVPFRIGAFEALPTGRINVGRLENASAEMNTVWGGEVGINLRRRIGG